MRQYEGLWHELRNKVLDKDNKILLLEARVSLSAPKKYHARIIKAVRKEKNLDLDFKFHTRRQEDAFFLYVETDPTAPFLLTLILKPRLCL